MLIQSPNYSGENLLAPDSSREQRHCDRGKSSSDAAGFRQQSQSAPLQHPQEDSLFATRTARLLVRR